MSDFQITVSGRGMKVTDSIRKYIEEKIDKYSAIYSSVVKNIEVECIQSVAAKGVDKDFRIEITANLPKVTARVEKDGPDIYGLIDLSTDVLIRKVKRYKDQFRKWEGKEKWIPIKDKSDDDSFISYTPKITRRKKIEDCIPMMPEEAIERMEMNDYSNYLFKDSKTGLPSLVYRREDGTYGLVQLCD